MNKVRRGILKKAISAITTVMDDVEIVKDEEQEALDSLPDGLADSSRASAMEENIDLLEEVYNNLEEAISTISDVINR